MAYFKMLLKMKKHFIIVFLLAFYMAKAQVRIETNTLDVIATLDIVSSGKGLLPPRITETQRSATDSLAVGLLIFNTTSGCLQWWNGSFWHEAYNAAAKEENEMIVQYIEGTVFCGSGPTEAVEVVTANEANWMDRNLGARQIANSSNDVVCYGGLYQWDRASDCHQCRDSETFTGPVEAENEGSGLVIGANDWLTNKDANRWGDTTDEVKGVYNPYLNGCRVLSETKWQAEKNKRNNSSWGNKFDTFNLAKVLAVAGRRFRNDGSLLDRGTTGFYFSSTVDGLYARSIDFTGSSVTI